MKLLAVILITCGSVMAQISGAGQIGCNGAPVTGAAWTSGTANNTSQTLATNVTSGAILVTLDQTSTITGGAVTFQGDPGDGNVVTLATWQVVDPTTAPFATIANPYTLVATTNKQFLILVGGMYKINLKLTTAITGTATITPFTTAWCGATPQVVFQASGANFSINNAQFGGSNTVTGTGASGSGIPRVTISNDSALAANQSVNVAQVGGTAPNLDPCQANAGSSATISLTAGGQIITGTSSKQTYICSFHIVTATAQNIALVEGTGTTCATNTAAMAGGTTAATGWNLAANGGIVIGNGFAWVAKTATTADNVCLLLSSTGQTSGVVRYVQQ